MLLRQCQKLLPGPHTGGFLVASTQRSNASARFCLVARRWFALSEDLIPKSFNGRSLNPGFRLSQAILGGDSEDIVRSAQAHNAEESRLIVAKRLGLDPPTSIPFQFDDYDSYQNSLASVVSEEARYCIFSALEALLPERGDGGGGDNNNAEQVKSGISMEYLDNPRTRIRVECWTHNPLSPADRKELRHGSVVAIFPKSLPRDPSNVILGVVQYGSDKPSVLPEEMQDEWDEDNPPPKEKLGDRLEIAMHTNNFEDAWPLREAAEMFFLVSILNFQRQFAACTDSGYDSLGVSLLGHKPMNTNSQDGMEAKNLENIGTLSHDATATNFEVGSSSLTNTSRFDGLNASQKEAIEEFISGKRTITIVQGPPGTGKTSMAEAAIFRFVERMKQGSDRKRLMVCGPTNKSVSVLARKVLGSVDPNDAAILLVGDKSELLVDNRADFEPFFVFTYLEVKKRELKGIFERLGEKKDSRSLDLFRQQGKEFFSTMKTQLPNYSAIRNLEWSFEGVVEKIEAKEEIVESNAEQGSAEPPENEKSSKGRQGKGKRDKSKNGEDEKIVTKKIRREHKKKIIGEFQRLDAQEVEMNLLNNANIVFCTLTTSGSSHVRRMVDVDDLIVDEASCATEPETLIPLHKNPARLLLVGDPKQLPATVQSPKAQECGLDRSLQERLMFKNDFPYTLLDVQYRMRPEISRWPNNQFYEGRIVDGDNVSSPDYQLSSTLLTGEPYIWVPVSGDELKDRSNSTFNIREAHVIAQLLLDWADKSDTPDWSAERIRVITYYQAQVRYLQRLFERVGINALVATVDSAQGSEADIVILSCVRGTSGAMGFVKDTRRLNVSLTRAKYQLVCVGNVHAMACLPEKGGNFVLRDLAEDAINEASLARVDVDVDFVRQSQRKGRRKNQNRKPRKSKKHPS